MYIQLYIHMNMCLKSSEETHGPKRCTFFCLSTKSLQVTPDKNRYYTVLTSAHGNTVKWGAIGSVYGLHPAFAVGRFLVLGYHQGNLNPSFQNKSLTISVFVEFIHRWRVSETFESWPGLSTSLTLSAC